MEGQPSSEHLAPVIPLFPERHQRPNWTTIDGEVIDLAEQSLDVLRALHSAATLRTIEARFQEAAILGEIARRETPPEGAS